MDEDPAYELIGLKSHLQRVLFLLSAIVLPVESHPVLADFQDALVGDCHTVRVPPEISDGL